jgi:flagellar biosynthesis/type III secretory pathway ATPase
VDEEQWRAAVRFKSLLAARKEVEDLVAVGAYRAGSRPLADLAIQQAECLTAFLCQPEDEIAAPADSRAALLELCGQTRAS